MKKMSKDCKMMKFYEFKEYNFVFNEKNERMIGRYDDNDDAVDGNK